ncbi:MAG: cation transporter [Clostridiales bacterium]|nr:cation transporter [Clostridiales bacterium]
MSEQKSRAQIGKMAGLIGIIANVILASGKLVIGVLSASMSIIADAINNFTDGISSVVALIGFKLSQKPADADHPFGHARFEYVSSLIVSIIVMFIGFELAKSSIEKIFNPEAINFSVLTLIILLISIVGKLALCFFNYSIAKKIDSTTLKATAMDCRNDVIMTSVILFATLFEYFTSIKIDGYTGLAVAIFIMISGFNLIKETSSPILGKKNDDHLKDLILDKIKEYPIVIGYHDLMIHDYGPGISFCSIHFEIDKNLDPLYVHELIDKFEREIAEYGTSLTVHYDPVITDSKELNILKHAVTNCIVNVDVRMSIHDFRTIPCDGFSKVFFDLALPENLENKKDELKTLIENELNSLGLGIFQAEITFDSIAFN